ncbi:hypothetical protein B0J15DRAFT_575618 [Fusarium solani]|uniref:Zn(2)-C6 fungal-type domain-containing protein n=1 Tax=Fusarium solani TaxID=169388 RepID=A0A9P9JMD8_FUSSL|nr:uncharacterized protein B0J15DRAFT_575618 [Fusarium solani]KAH7230322.1 hypothetical protein B0J15DRAFT_575618 [Fusarium solani]
MLVPHVDVIMASPKGDEAPIDPYSVEETKDDDACQAFLRDNEQLYQNTTKLESFLGRSSEFAGIFFAGGHGLNRGRPSKDYLPCPKRKLRCDLKARTCGQCQRAGLECHGYRKPQDLVFRDQTDVARHKVLAHVGVPILNLDIDTRCRDTFFALYVTGISRSCTSLVPLYTKAPATGHLACSVDAVSLAFAGVQFESQEAMSLASKRYVTAIQNLGQALRHPRALKSDQTLQSMLLLDLYEKICGRDRQQPRSWMSAGDFDLSSPIACELARNVVTTLTISCGAVRAPVPDSVMLLRRRLDGHVLDTKWGFMNILLDIVNLRADMHNGRWLNHTAEAAERAKGLDRRLVSLEQKLPEDWKPVPCSTAIRHQPLLLDGHHDAYPNHFVTQLWNTLRAMRLEMTKIIKNHDPSSEAAASETINSIARKMCRAVPQFMLPGSRPENAGPFSPMEKLQCRSLLSCLYLAAQLSADEHLREWTCACMDYMTERGEMRVARDIAAIIRLDCMSIIIVPCPFPGTGFST